MTYAQSTQAANTYTMRPTLQQIMQQVSEYYNISIADISSKNRIHSIMWARQVFIFFALKNRYNYNVVAKYINMHRTNVINSNYVVLNTAAIYTAYQQELQEIDEKIKIK